MNWKKILLNGRVILLTLFLIMSIVSLATRGLTFGLDISGGISITVKLEKPVDTQTMEQVRIALEQRLNALGVKDITIEPWGNQFVLVKVAGVNEEEANQLVETIERQGVFYAEFQGVIFATGKDILNVGSVSYDPRQSAWVVPFRLSKDAAEKFAKLALGKAGYPVDMFLDPPVNSTLVVSKDFYDALNSPRFMFEGNMTLAERIEKAFNIKIIKYNNQTAQEIAKIAKGSEKVLLVDVDGNLEKQLKALGLKVEVWKRGNDEDMESFVRRVLRLYGPYRVGEGLATGRASTEVMISIGGSQNDLKARNDAQVVAVVLRSGSLPVKLSIERIDYISPKLGEDFKRQVLIAGIAALLVVGAIVYLHYRKLKIAIPVMFTSFSEVLIILGIASIIRWNLDLPSIAGIIAAIGTGVDQQIVITDELLGDVTAGKKRIVKRSGILKRMGRAFFIILASASTTIVAMSFLFKFFVGGLRGFAFTTILGILIGILITRPAYGEIAKVLIGERR
ncbi:preprotein translocase subunit SecD [Pyrococcus abyssi]|uniref:Protein-export membrane protein SecD n=1 Tax=Pyrococcus abyssi (strain GE5 / Orsay) TaxID=272844 RepID=Q9UXT9_PYRAB|nr:preprotein translocase subunit SecD [Pyrococcus abyssi]CAB50674.1 secD protein-export membrane protein [Pyrococcus abyssi GE5]CCE71243.1 TPA: preprotein translocase subunit SecD [Pyrococcus abyssi GE5]